MKSRQKKNTSMNHLAVNRRIKRSMSLADGRENSLPIPIDIIIIIFSMLSLKSIARCRCVSKLWASILRRSDFTELFFSMSCSRGPKLLFAFCNKSKLFFSSPHPQNSAKNLSHVVSNYQKKFSSDYDFENSDLVNGLISLNDVRILNGKRKNMMMICNPSTAQTLILPEAKTSRYCMWSLFGYDPIDKQFKVLAMMANHEKYDVIMCDEFQVLTLGNGNLSWKMIDCCIPHNPPHKKICIDGVLYYTSIDWFTKTCKLVCFDIRSEKFTFIKVMETLKEVMLGKNTELINYNSKFGLLQWYGHDNSYGLSNGKNIKFHLWILEDYEKHEWYDHTFLFSHVPKNIDETFMLRFAGVTQRKEIVLWTMWTKFINYPFYVYYLNLEKKTIKRVEIRGMDIEKTSHIFLDHVENVNLYMQVFR